jgi:hypothetical protein
MEAFMKYNLVGINGNAHVIMGYVGSAMKECGKTRAEIEAYTKDAMSGDYSRLVVVSDRMLDELNKSVRKMRAKTRRRN